MCAHRERYRTVEFLESPCHALTVQLTLNTMHTARMTLLQRSVVVLEQVHLYVSLRLQYGNIPERAYDAIVEREGAAFFIVEGFVPMLGAHGIGQRIVIDMDNLTPEALRSSLRTATTDVAFNLLRLMVSVNPDLTLFDHMTTQLRNIDKWASKLYDGECTLVRAVNIRVRFYTADGTPMLIADLPRRFPLERMGSGAYGLTSIDLSLLTRQSNAVDCKEVMEKSGLPAVWKADAPSTALKKLGEVIQRDHSLVWEALHSSVQQNIERGTNPLSEDEQKVYAAHLLTALQERKQRCKERDARKKTVSLSVS